MNSPLTFHGMLGTFELQELRQSTVEQGHQILADLSFVDEGGELVLDCAKVDVMTSAWKAVLASLSKRLREERGGARLRLRNVNRMLCHAFEVTCLNQLFTVEGGEE